MVEEAGGVGLDIRECVAFDGNIENSLDQQEGKWDICGQKQAGGYMWCRQCVVLFCLLQLFKWDTK